jgi:hypothetical protein
MRSSAANSSANTFHAFHRNVQDNSPSKAFTQALGAACLEDRVDTLCKLVAVLHGFGRGLDRYESFVVCCVMVFAQPEVFGHRGKDRSVEMPVVPEPDVVASQRAIDFDGVVSGQINEVEGLVRSIRGGDVELEDFIDETKGNARCEIVSFLRCIVDHRIVEIFAVTWEVIVVCQSVQDRAWTARYVMYRG